MTLAYILLLHTHSPNFPLCIWQDLVSLSLFHCHECSVQPPTAAPIPPRFPSNAEDSNGPQSLEEAQSANKGCQTNGQLSILTPSSAP